jgi:hypothetical protein
MTYDSPPTRANRVFSTAEFEGSYADQVEVYRNLLPVAPASVVASSSISSSMPSLNSVTSDGSGAGPLMVSLSMIAPGEVLAEALLADPGDAVEERRELQLAGVDELVELVRIDRRFAAPGRSAATTRSDSANAASFSRIVALTFDFNPLSPLTSRS